MNAGERITENTIRIVDEGPAECGPYGEIFRNRFVVFRNDPVEFPDGTRGGHVALHPAANPAGGAAILPVHKGKLVLCREFRHAIQGWQVGIPRGFAEAGEAPEQTARRELTEEYRVNDFSLEALGEMAPDSSVQSACVSMFIAELESLPQNTGEFAESLPVIVTVSEALANLGIGEWSDSFLAFALLQAIARGRVAI